MSKQTSKYISKVDFKLHPVYIHSDVATSAGPHSITRIGNQMFRVRMVVHWQEWTGLGCKTLYHMLNFSSECKKQAFLVSVPKVKPARKAE